MKYHALEYVSDRLDALQIPRTYFLCGQFLEAMLSVFGDETIKPLFDSVPNLIEIADHTYSHNVFKFIPARSDKSPISVEKIVDEYRYNTMFLSRVFGRDLRNRGLRTPLGHFRGLTGEYELVNKLTEEGVLYVSSDLRDKSSSINPPLVDEDGSLRQPYFYDTRLLEIPSHGWQDTAFCRQSKTPLNTTPPSSYPDIIEYYHFLISEAVTLSKMSGKDFYLGLVLHPYNIWQYDKPRAMFDDLYQLSLGLGAEFACYKNVCDQLIRK